MYCSRSSLRLDCVSFVSLPIQTFEGSAPKDTEGSEAHTRCRSRANISNSEYRRSTL